MQKQVDYIIVGCGLAGIAFTEQLLANNKTFAVFDDASQQSSVVAAGLYNPVILKRFSQVWQAKTQLELLTPSYTKIEKRLGITLDYKLKLLRRFASVEEQNLWFTAADHPILKTYLQTPILKNTNSKIKATYGYGSVLNAGRIDTKTLINRYKLVLKETDRLIDDTFNYKVLKLQNKTIQYKNYNANHLVFAEGYGLKQNPFFNHLPLYGTKGEVLTIKAPDLKIDYAVKSSVFLVPLGNDLYKVGATYNWTDKTNIPTAEGKAELISKLKNLLHCNFEIVAHSAGIRPTVKDRRPLVGSHPKYNNMYVLNGLGTRGVMIAPYVAQQLYNYIETNQPLEEAIDISRF